MDVVLVHVTKNGGSTAVPLPRERTLVGRLDDCQIRIPAAGISRKHCEILIQDGSIMINDLGSSNGTYVNQQRVDSQALSAGDMLSFGGQVFLVTVNNEPSGFDPETMFEEGLPENEGIAPMAKAPPRQAPAPKKKVSANDIDIDINEDSSMMDFDFDFDDDDDQPPL